jgi:light-regulated signal transduction histidine kinase (bacteriophytochrome)/CheY-like chemotaxis protein
LGALLGHDFREALSARLAAGALDATLWETTVLLEGVAWDASVHLHAGLILVEIEAVAVWSQAQALGTTRAVQRCIADLRLTAGDVAAMASLVVNATRRLTGYERVLIYRFDRDWHGQAVAEDRTPDWDHSLRDIRFPASNIPAQARALYVKSLIRWMPQRDADQIAIAVDPGWAASQVARQIARPADSQDDGSAIDLSFARLRSFSPVHREFHRSMGVDGSMSLSLLQDGRLWGLVVCHHRGAHHPSPEQRLGAMALADAFSLCVGAAERVGVEHARRADTLKLVDLLAHMAAAEDVDSALTSGAVTIANLFEAAGAAVLHDGEVLLVGQTPPHAAVQDLAIWLRQRGGEVFHTDQLCALYPGWEAHVACAMGVLAVFLTPERGDMLIWFRGEETQSVKWGGNLLKPTDTDQALPHTFERWVEQRHGVVHPWAPWELEIAETLRHALTEVIVRSLRRIAVLNEQLRQSQKMEAVGQLTAGIAHDFNNLLTGVIGSLEMTRTRIGQGRVAEIDRYIDAATSSANRAAVLTHRLLAFSRRQTLDPQPIDVNRLIASMQALMLSTVGNGVTLEIVAKTSLQLALCDANQLENALLNLAINARDAMPAGGRLTIETADIDLGPHDMVQHEVKPGRYVVLCVTDTGAGMTPEVKARVFEPFFTTKPMGQGTGLGLSMVYGFAKQSDGYVRIDSAPGEGASVRLYLPCWEKGPVAVAALTGHRTNNLAAGGVKTVLVVDDETNVLMLVGDTLRDLGYRVLQAVDGAQALQISAGQAFDMLVTDVGLPGGLNGRQLADAIRVAKPALPVLFITGYAEQAALGGGLSDGALGSDMYVVTKPFPLDAFAAKVKSIIG